MNANRTQWVAIAMAAFACNAVACGDGRPEEGGGRGSGGQTGPGFTSDDSTSEGDASSGGTTADDSGAPGSDGPDTGEGETDGGGGTAGSEGDPSSGGGETDGPRFDIPVPTDPGDPGEGSGCQKVDFLFVIDNSGSMASEQDNLADSFPGFIEAIRSVVEVQDFRILVTDTDSTFGFVFPMPTGCDATMGAGLLKNPAQMDCGVSSGVRWMDQTQPNLEQVFTCLGTVGTEGNNDEQTASATLAALGPENAPGGCNEGFVRDDAILVVTLITDEEDNPNDFGGIDTDRNSPGDPATWRQAVIDAKGGDEQAVVMLGLLGDTDLPGAICPPLAGIDGAEAAPRLRQLTESFTFGDWASVCTQDYAPFFESSISLIDTACDDFRPPG